MQTNERELVATQIENYYDFDNLSEEKAREHLMNGLNGLEALHELTEYGYMKANIVYMQINDAISNCGLTPDEEICLIERYVNRGRLQDVAKIIKRSQSYVFTSSESAFNKLYQYIRGE